MTNVSGRSFGPDLVRAVAIALVILSHTFPGFHTVRFVPGFRNICGFLGVEVFFVLSGYLIGGILLRQFNNGEFNNSSGLWSFWIRRWFRTLPNYYLFLVLYIIVERWLGNPEGIEAFRFIWFGQALNVPHPIFFTVAWSLAVEEWFYFLFPLVLFFTNKSFRSPRRTFVWTIAVFLLIPIGLRWFTDVDNWDNGLRKVTFCRLDTIMFGVILALIKSWYPVFWMRLKGAWCVGVFGLIAVAICVAPGDMTTGSWFNRVGVFELTSISLCLALPAALELKKSGNDRSAIVKRISLWSYSLYLSHSLLTVVFVALLESQGLSSRGSNAVLISCSVWLSSIIVSAAIYEYYEKPLTDLRDRFAPTAANR